ncbi:hypothetical protein MTR_8g097330 [Medicago truncatula]|uniref:Uncharacterized protein n=1 Tax=Medicago truncatula TaxID=3880 RepID=A0A072TU43_MEDTR|nr:hypothetical protein MTR_8g097330 [Medicago truncatula]
MSLGFPQFHNIGTGRGRGWGRISKPIGDGDEIQFLISVGYGRVTEKVECHVIEGQNHNSKKVYCTFQFSIHTTTAKPNHSPHIIKLGVHNNLLLLSQSTILPGSCICNTVLINRTGTVKSQGRLLFPHEQNNVLVVC